VTTGDTTYLVAYDYGQGAVWAIVSASSAAEISDAFPELTIIDERPAWMTDEELERIRQVHSYGLHDTTFGLLADIVDARH
jgi:hypothetical protein